MSARKEKPKNGGNAFPSGTGTSSDPLRLGMSLRDWFAGQALAGICAHSDTWGLDNRKIGSAAYEIADAMLAARDQTP